jgi:Pro-kumamolisin, activation domain
MIPYPDLRLCLAISANASRANRTFKSRAATLHRTRVVFAMLMLWISACSKSSNWNHLSSPNPESRLAPGRVSLKNQVPDLKLRETALAGGHPAPSEMPITVCVGLTMLNQGEFNRKAAAFMDRNSPSFGGRFTTQELQKFARPLSDYEAIERWLRSYGVKILGADSEPLVHSIRAKGTAAQWEEALNLSIYQSADGKWFANTSEPQIPTELNGVIAGFAGLDNLSGYGSGPRISSCV